MKEYFIGAPAGPGHEHMTIKYLGKLNDAGVQEAKQKMTGLSNVEKFLMESQGLGILGRKKPYLVNYIKPNKRMEKALKVFNNTFQTQVPHVTVMEAKPSGVTGPVSLMGDKLVNEIVLYRVEGHQNYTKVHSVKLKKRKPMQ